MQRQGIKHAVHLGDQYHCGSATRWRRCRREATRHVPSWLWAIGNHELVQCGQRKRRTRADWRKVFGQDTFTTERIGDWTLIVLDTATSRVPNHAVRFARALRRAKKVLLFMHRPPPIPRRGDFRVRWGRHYHWYSRMEPVPWRDNDWIWEIAKAHRSRIKAIFHGHHHAYRAYHWNGIRAYCSGGGGGRLQRRTDFFHYLVLTLGRTATVRVERIRDRR